MEWEDLVEAGERNSFGSQVMRWDGTNWSSLGSGLPGSALALAAADGAVFAGGYFGVQKWNGATWTPLGANVNGTVYAIAARISEVFVGGNFTQAGSLSAQNIARWNGTDWSALGSGLDAAVNALVFRGSDLIAGGAFTNAAASVANCIAAWDGTNWTSLGGGLSHGLPNDNLNHRVPTSVNALAATPEGLVYAAGNFTLAEGKPANFIAYWDGGAWQALGNGLNLIAYARASTANSFGRTSSHSVVANKYPELYP